MYMYIYVPVMKKVIFDAVVDVWDLADVKVTFFVPKILFKLGPPLNHEIQGLILVEMDCKERRERKKRERVGRERGREREREREREGKRDRERERENKSNDHTGEKH